MVEREVTSVQPPALVRPPHTGYLLAKRALDISVAVTGLLLASPILGTLALAVRRGSPGPVIYRRTVLGTAERSFDAFKFRTMYVNGDEIIRQQVGLKEVLERNGKLKDDPRVTPTGRWMRKLSLDELPQLFNVLRGEMSLVGPRMITRGELSHYGTGAEELLTVKPGLTGLWQVSGRADLGYEERVRLDLLYIRHRSFWLDIKLLAQTVPAVLARRGAY